MKNLAIILTGKMEMIFTETNYFSKLYYHICNNYNNTLFICIVNINDEILNINLNNYFKSLNHIIINYNDYENEFKLALNNKYDDINYKKIFEKYNKNNSHAITSKEIEDPINNLSPIIQSHQLQLGIKALIDYEKKNNITYDIIMRTRYDIRYPEFFYPQIPSDILHFNNLNKNIIQNSMNKLNLKNIDDLIEFNKNNKMQLPECRIYDSDIINITFGGSYFHNSKNLEKIKNGCKDFIYLFNDYFYFGNRELMLKLYNMFNESFLIEPNEENEELYNHIYSPESQMIIYLLKKDINFLMYNNNTFSVVRQWEYIYSTLNNI